MCVCVWEAVSVIQFLVGGGRGKLQRGHNQNRSVRIKACSIVSPPRSNDSRYVNKKLVSLDGILVSCAVCFIITAAYLAKLDHPRC